MEFDRKGHRRQWRNANLSGKNLILAYVVLIFLGGCYAATPMVRMEKGESLATYKIFKVTSTVNETGKKFEFDVAGELTQQIKSKLKEKGYKINCETDTQEVCLVIKSRIITYEPGSVAKRWILQGTGKTRATVRTFLIDNKTENIIGEIVTSEEVSGGGLFSAGADKWILEVIAKGITNEIDKRVKGD